ncbi:peptide/nickel transport system permease protein [Thermosporothrix hazakensis]|jgi:peptide/nickel transport system permease protein|uniref:Peptide/nickel transport system permease protein n=2 Tax=Thermosporothrix TaxID=768650 RepID=A0A326UD37_THEHA|nr:ABC transporter permease [Thermosporothrix hazakensis]PZW36512.1 peptide/nickel transport system permease protein [Thermosporothrix hazakensis]BBH88979.1 peptide ABC transporter permease [Thermosporothrix sp. COM3]GCE47165.1 peptide ABC transporter permease [Thermosporothrix hazakensis]
MRHLLRRIFFYLAAVWVAITLNFFIPRLAPGNPAQALVARLAQKGPVPPEMLKAVEAAFGINSSMPLWQQYFVYLGDLLRGNFGMSYTYYPNQVSDVIGQSVIWTLILGGVAVVLSFLLGSLIGAVLAWKRGSLGDSVLVPLMNFLSAIPYFWLAMIIVFYLGFVLRWFPFSDGYDLDLDIGLYPEFIGSVIVHSILPALTIVLSSIAGWMLTMRNSMVTTLSEDYVLMARAKGLSSRRVMFAYAARNAILPNISGFAIAIGGVVGGQLMTEIIFSYPGIGYSLLQAVQGQDYPLIQTIFLIIALAILGANFLADMLYVVLDPRVRQERSA